MTDDQKRESSFPELHLLDSLEDFQVHLYELLSSSRLYLAVLTSDLDSQLFGQENIIEAMSRLARNHPQASIRILLKNEKHLVTGRHPLRLLHRRIPSKIAIRKLTTEPDDDAIGYVIGDRERLLVKNDDAIYSGFMNYAARPEAKHYLEQFDYLWGRHSDAIADLREISL